MLFPMILIAILVVVFGATVYWAAGNLGPPASRRRQRQQVVSGFQLVGFILLGIMLATLLVGGIGIAFFGIESSLTSKVIAVVVVAAALAVIAMLMERWAKYFASWMAFGVLNSLIMACSGHVINRPGVPVSRPVALAMSGLFAITVATTIRFAGSRRLNTLDKVALLFWLLTFAVGANTERFMLVAFGMGCAGLVGAWLYGRRQSV